MTKASSYILVLFIGALLGYWLKVIEVGIQPNYRWVQVFNKTDCEIKSASVLFPNRSVTISSAQFEYSVYPNNSDSYINIPVLASETQKYRISLEFNDCPSRLGDPQGFSSGSHIQLWVDKSEMRYAAR